MALNRVVAAFCYCFLFFNSAVISQYFAESEINDPYVSSVLNYLNAKRGRIYNYNKGSLIDAQKKADITEILVDVYVDCTNEYPDVPCREEPFTCHAFVQNDVEGGGYKIMSDVKCVPKFRNIAPDDTYTLETTEAPFKNADAQQSDKYYTSPLEAAENVQNDEKRFDLSVEPISTEQDQGVDFVAMRRNSVPCLGCPFDLSTDADGVEELVSIALRHIESERDPKYAALKVRRLQRQIVAGVKYILQLEVSATTCPKSVQSSSECQLDLNVEPMTCEVTFIEKPWLSKDKLVISNNCTVSQEFSLAVFEQKDDLDNEIKPLKDNADTEMDPARLADLESQILLAEPNVKETPKTDDSGVVAVTNDTSTPQSDNENIQVDPPSIEAQTYDPPQAPVVDEDGPFVMLYDPRQDRTLGEPESALENLTFDGPSVVQVTDDRLKRALEGSSSEESKSDSSSSEERKNKNKNNLDGGKTGISVTPEIEVFAAGSEAPQQVRRKRSLENALGTSEESNSNSDGHEKRQKVKRDLKNTSEDSDSKSNSSEEKQQKVKRDLENTSEESDSKSNSKEEKQGRVRRDLHNTSEESNSKSDSSEEKQHKVKRDLQNTSEESNSKSNSKSDSSEEKKQKVKRDLQNTSEESDSKSNSSEEKQKKVKRDVSNTSEESNSKSNSSEEKQQRVKRDLGNTSEESNSKSNSSEEKQKKVKRDTPNTSEESNSKSDSSEEKKQKVKRDLGNTSEDSNSKSNSSEEKQKKVKRDAPNTSEESNSKSDSSEEKKQKVKRDLGNTSEESNSKSNSSEEKQKKVKRDAPNTSEESNSKSDSSEEKKQKVKRDLQNTSEESNSKSNSSEENQKKVKRDVANTSEESNSKSNSSEEKEQKVKRETGDSSSSSDSNDKDKSHSSNNSDDDNKVENSRKEELKSDSSSDSDDKDRHKRSVGKLEKITSDEKVVVRDLADFAAASLDKIDDDNHKRVILQILGAKKLKLDGIYYQIILRLGISKCLEGEHNENCRDKLFTNLTKICKVQVHVDDDFSNPKVVKSQCQNIKKDENDRNRTNYSRYKRAMQLVGGHTPMSVNDPTIQEFVSASLAHLDSVSEGDNKHKAIEVISATSQVVSGVSYNVKVKIGRSDCKLVDPKPVDACDVTEGSVPVVCTIKVWDRPWLKKRQYTVKCDDKEYTFASDPSSREKRSLFLGGKTDMSVVHPRARQFVKMGLKYLSAKSNFDGEYILNNIRQVRKQTVAGSLWNIDTVIDLCPAYSEIRDTCRQEVCQYSVHERPWLIDGLNMNVTCESDDNVYSFTPGSELYEENQNHVHNHLTKAFNQFLQKYEKVYRNKEEYNFRLKVFKDNLNTIALLNKFEQGTGRYGLTEFADMTSKEFSKSHGLRLDMLNENEVPLKRAIIPDVSLPVEFDWRKKGAVAEVKDQGSCGSCWAFSVTGNIEGQFAIKYGKLLEFSEQELIDCDKSDDGCNGGYMTNAYSAIEKLGGLEQESVYPYEAEDEKCKFDSAKVNVQLTGALNISQNETDMAKWLTVNGPISVGINANAMQFYMGGVSHPWKMLCSPKDLDHGVLIVGYGVHKYSLFNKTLPYWIVKNSWGPSWGEQGYYRVYRGDGTCGVNLMASSAIVK
ncbi:uncharacterized protein LOC132702986 [Cylas formicarius]|uniref:uncharacterized protein LOC132702986 n=1 Tax=Cylas formicarius TaxID=197179 RepID=UPI0029587FB4|nr:uncharacterized protein LOC132702986 [Cylas formicarius]